MTGKQILTTILFVLSISAFGQKNFELVSPKGQVKISIALSDSVYYSVHMDGISVLQKSSLALITDKFKAGIKPGTPKAIRRSVKETIINPVPFKRKNIP